VPLSSGDIYAMSSNFVADVFDHHAGWADKLAGETLPPFQGGDHLVMTLREPIGVVIPWNAPLALFAQKVAPALAAGCTIVLKPCKRVSLELGGKSPSVVFADADVSSAAAVTMGTVTLGLSGQVCAAQTRALRVTRALRAGTAGVNGFQLEPNWPFGGYRQSGLGREGGRAAVESYTELKTVLLPCTGEMM